MLEVAGSHVRQRSVRDLPELLDPGDLIVANHTKVMHARLMLRKPGGGKSELLVLRVLSQFSAEVMLRSGRKLSKTSGLTLDTDAGHCTVSVKLISEGVAVAEFSQPVAWCLEQAGRIPLPPYIRRPPEQEDATRYQTIFAREDLAHSAAAPTAGLHIDSAIRKELERRGVEWHSLRLDIGAGTFLPVRSQDFTKHKMHSEFYHLEDKCTQAMQRAKERGKRILVIGTSTLRALEAARRQATDAQGVPLPSSGETDLFIYPPYRDFCADMLLTNFHAPRSTLLMLVSAFGGMTAMQVAYKSAVADRMRFLSYGDCMLIHKAEAPET